MDNNLERFLIAQQTYYQTALQEIKSGKKRSHWMWFIFPQIAGLGYSETARYYAIKNMEEAKAYMEDYTLGTNLIEISQALLEIKSNDADEVMGRPDNLLWQNRNVKYYRRYWTSSSMGNGIRELWRFYS